jgi:hypothetical protein
MSNPTLPSVHIPEYIHPSLRIRMIRGRGQNWWEGGQMILEDEIVKGRKLEIGAFYYFLKDKFNIGGEIGYFFYGNIYMGDHWIMHSMALPEDVEDAPYKMVDVIERWRLNAE